MGLEMNYINPGKEPGTSQFAIKHTGPDVHNLQFPDSDILDSIWQRNYSGPKSGKVSTVSWHGGHIVVAIPAGTVKKHREGFLIALAEKTTIVN